MTEHERIIRERDDLAFIKNENLWPMWPMCPVKRRKNNEMECGFLYSGQGPMVVKAYVFESWTPEQYDRFPKFRYDSFEALLADGWMVD